MGFTFTSIRVAVAFMAAFLLSACYHYRVDAPALSAAKEPISATRWAFFWGLAQPGDISTKCVCLNRGLKEATATTNAGYALLTVVTLGIVAPLELEFVCSKPPADPSGSDWRPPNRDECPNILADTPESRTDAGEAHQPDGGFIPNDPDAGSF